MQGSTNKPSHLMASKLWELPYRRFWYYLLKFHEKATFQQFAVDMTHCKEAWNLSTAPFHSLYFRFSHISLSLYGFRDHPRMPSNYGCYQISNRLSLNSVYYQKTPWIIIKMHEKSGNFDKTQNYLSSGRQNTQNKGLYESPFELSYQGHVICFYRGWYSMAI